MKIILVQVLRRLVCRVRLQCLLLKCNYFLEKNTLPESRLSFIESDTCSIGMSILLGVKYFGSVEKAIYELYIYWKNT